MQKENETDIRTRTLLTDAFESVEPDHGNRFVPAGFTKETPCPFNRLRWRPRFPVMDLRMESLKALAAVADRLSAFQIATLFPVVWHATLYRGGSLDLVNRTLFHRLILVGAEHTKTSIVEALSIVCSFGLSIILFLKKKKKKKNGGQIAS
jgi:hypothetical protein